LISLSLLNSTLSVFRRITIVIAIAAAFLFGLATTVYLSLLSPEVTVPNVLGKDRFEAERTLGEAGLNFRVRATRPSNQVKPDTVLFQLPRAGEVVKAGQTVAMDISRATKEGESSQVMTAPAEEKKSETVDDNANENENKSRRPRNTNKNGNENSNTNANRSSNVNRRSKETADNSNKTENENTTSVNQNDEGGKSNSNTRNQNSNRAPSPRPSPAARNDNRDNR
jgi:beta-lactam-binding protein with PASTA domain